MKANIGDKNMKKTEFIIVISYVFFSIITCAFAANPIPWLPSSNVAYDNSGTDMTDTNVNSAIDSLYDAANKYSIVSSRVTNYESTKAVADSQTFTGLPVYNKTIPLGTNTTEIANNKFFQQTFENEGHGDVGEIIYSYNKSDITVPNNTVTDTVSINLTEGKYYIVGFVVYDVGTSNLSGSINVNLLKGDGNSYGIITSMTNKIYTNGDYANDQYVYINAPINVSSTSAGTWKLTTKQTTGSSLKIWKSRTTGSTPFGAYLAAIRIY